MSLNTDFTTTWSRPASGAIDQKLQDARRRFYEDGVIDEHEAQALFKQSSELEVHHDGWPQFFVEALTDYVVNQANPRGYVTIENAEWLISSILHDGMVSAHCEIELLVSVIETAIEVPTELRAFTLEVIGDAVCDGDAQVTGNDQIKPGQLGANEAALIRRAIFGAGSEGNIVVSRAEAEFLFDLNDALVDQPNHPDWQLVFRQGITNHLMAAQTWHPVPVEQATAQEDEAAQSSNPSTGVSSFLGRMFSCMPTMDALRKQPDESAEPAACVEGQIEQAEAITDEEATWLLERILRDHRLHENEIAVLKFIKAESPRICQQINVLLDELGS